MCAVMFESIGPVSALHFREVREPCVSKGLICAFLWATGSRGKPWMIRLEPPSRRSRGRLKRRFLDLVTEDMKLERRGCRG